MEIYILLIEMNKFIDKLLMCSFAFKCKDVSNSERLECI